MKPRGLLAAALLPALCFAALARETRAPAPAPDYGPATEKLLAFVGRQMKEKGIPAISVALVDGDRTVWVRGLGDADPVQNVQASGTTVYRVGSVSKLFTDIGIMQLSERGEIDLDAPIQTILPDFRPRNPFGPSVTLRELMSHRAGLVREPPVGSYFDPTGPSLAATVASLNDTTLVYPPGTHIKYSNAGIAVVGYVLERRAREPFAKFLKHAVLDPIGMGSSSFEPEPRIRERLARGTMWGYDGRSFPAPTFELGMAPAGSLYSTVEDLARFLSVLFAGGEVPGGRVLRRETLEQMWKPQFAEAGARTGYGIGFRIGELEGHRSIGHGGAIYGFATALAGLPDERLGAVAVATLDSTNAVTDRIVREALRLMLAARAGKPLPEPETTEPLLADLAHRLAGAYGQDGKPRVDLIELPEGLSLLEREGGFAPSLRKAGDALMTDGRLGIGTPVGLTHRGISLADRALARLEVGKPPAAGAEWKDLIGEYGWDYDILYILESDEQLTALIEWFEFDPLTPISRDVFRFPDRGLYDHETLTFERDPRGRVTGVRVGPVLFLRRAVGPEEGHTFQITPVRPVEALRAEASAATPPPQPADLLPGDLVELVTLDPTIRLDVRYATSNNFLGVPLYSQPRAFLQRPAAEALARAHKKLEAEEYGLLIHDAYRPWYVTKMFWDATPKDKHIFVADPATGSRHNRGCAVDLTLYDRKTGAPLTMTGGYDEMSDRSFAFYPGGTSLQRWQRDLLRRAMEEQGFAVYEWEWWHFDYKDWEKYPVGNVRFEELRTK